MVFTMELYLRAVARLYILKKLDFWQFWCCHYWVLSCQALLSCCLVVKGAGMLLGITVLAAEGPTTPATGVFVHGDITHQAKL